MKDVKEKEMLEKILIDPSIHPRMKAGCIGEFTVSTQQGCPVCWDKDWNDASEEDCEFCNNESDENGMSELLVDIPWTTQKEIFKRMCYFKYQAMIEDDEE
jgi:hypothetical protein